MQETRTNADQLRLRPRPKTVRIRQKDQDLRRQLSPEQNLPTVIV